MISPRKVQLYLCVAVCSGGGYASAAPQGNVTFLTRSVSPAASSSLVTVHGPSTIAPFDVSVSASSQGPCSIFNGAFSSGLEGWEIEISDGGPPDGSVGHESGTAVLREGRSFLTTLSQSFCIGNQTESLRFDLVDLGLDLTAGVIPDAFEVSLLDANFQSVVGSWSPAATSFYNVQEDGTVFAADRVSIAGSTVTVDLVGVAANDVRIYFDLVGADTDDASFAVVDNIELSSGGVGMEFCVGVGCPCGNDSLTGGCLNTLGQGALLSAANSASISADDLVLSVQPIPASFAYFFLGGTETCSPLGDGLLGVAPGPYQSGLMRFLVQSAEAGGPLELGPGLIDFANTSIGAGGFITVGSTWYFQVAYRDAPVSPCGSLFNLSNGLAVTFAP